MAALRWAKPTVALRSTCLKIGARRHDFIRPCAARLPTSALPIQRITFSTTRLRCAPEATQAKAASADDFEGDETSSPPPRVKLRDYQEQAVKDCLDAIASGVTRIGVSSPTGSGKTTMFTELIARLPNIEPASSEASTSFQTSNAGSRVLIVVGSTELAHQAAMAVARAHPHLHVEIEQGARFKASGFADVTVATYQTLVRGSGSDRLEKFSPDGLKAIIVDEAHHAASPSYLHLLSRFDEEIGMTREERAEQRQAAEQEREQNARNVASRRKIPIIGFSATFSRHDGLALGRVFDRIVFHRDFLSMIDDNWLCPVRFTSIRSDLDLSSVKVSAASGDFLPKSLASHANTPAINRLIVRSWLDKAAGRRSTLVFCVDIAHTIELTMAFRDAGVDARYIHGGTTMKERKQVLQDFKDGQYQILLNCAILTEGFDLPQIDTVIMARPTRSRNLFSQMIGRGLRLSPETGKEDCLILDLVGSIERGVVCTPTLFGLDPEDAIEGATLEELKERQTEAETEQAETEDLDPEKVTFVDYASPHELQEALMRRGHNNIARLSSNAWVDCGGDTYILEIPRKGFIRVEPADPRGSSWSAHFTQQMADREEAFALTGKALSPYRRPVSILEDEPAPTLESCIRVCDTYATGRILRSGPMNTLIRRDAAWRKAPASESQRKFVAKRIGYKPIEELALAGIMVDEDKQLKAEQTLESLTKGKAGEILTRLKFGFKKRWESDVKSKNRALAADVKERRRRAKETVEVGDL